jgi:hypothetical protein
MLKRVPKRPLFILHFWIWVLWMSCYQEGQELCLSRVEQVLYLLKQNLWETPLHQHFHGDLFHGDLFLGIDLGRPEYPGLPRSLRTSRVYPGYSGSESLNGYILGEEGMKAPSTPSFTTLSCHFDLNTSYLIYPLLHSPWLKFGEICCGDLRGFESKSLESASELISHL